MSGDETGWRNQPAVDALAAEFESVDSFFQALLGLRSLCSAFDRSLDRLVELPRGATTEWARSGEVPAQPARAVHEEEPHDACVEVLLGAIALRRAADRSFEEIAQTPASEAPRAQDPARAGGSTRPLAERLLR